MFFSHLNFLMSVFITFQIFFFPVLTKHINLLKLSTDLFFAMKSSSEIAADNSPMHASKPH